MKDYTAQPNGANYQTLKLIFRISEIISLGDEKTGNNFKEDLHVLLLDDVKHGHIRKLNWDLLLGLGFGKTTNQSVLADKIRKFTQYLFQLPVYEYIQRSCLISPYQLLLGMPPVFAFDPQLSEITFGGQLVSQMRL